MIRAMSLVDCPYPAFESYKVVVIGETKRPSSGRISFFQIARETHEKKLKFYQLPSILESKEGKEARSNSIAHFIACTSPGPNAFLLITDLCHRVDVSNLLRPYLNYFGPNIMRFLVVMFITKESKLQSNVDEYIQHSPDCQAVLKQCENRFITFDKRSQDHQIPDIMNDLVRLIRQMLTQNKEQFYSNEMFRQSEKEIQRATELIENENQLAIRKYEEKIKTLKQSNAREKAAEQIISQQSFIDIVSSGAHFL